MFEKAIELDPQYADAYTRLGWAYAAAWVAQWSQDPKTLEQAFELAQKAITSDNSLSHAHRLLGFVCLWKKQHDRAIAEVERAIALDPNFADNYAVLGLILSYAARPEEAIRLMEKARRLNPHYPVPYLSYLGHAYRLAGRYEEAIAALKRAISRNPDYLASHLHLAVIYSELGREGEARAEVAEILRLSPNYSVDGVRQRLPFKDPAEVERYLANLRKAGLK